MTFMKKNKKASVPGAECVSGIVPGNKKVKAINFKFISFGQLIIHFTLISAESCMLHLTDWDFVRVT